MILKFENVSKLLGEGILEFFRTFGLKRLKWRNFWNPVSETEPKKFDGVKFLFLSTMISRDSIAWLGH